MLKIDSVQVIDNITVYGDDSRFDTFYLLPQQPRFRLDENGNPVFKFLKYRFPVDREDGKKGGGYLVFDVEFVVPEPKMPGIKDQLQSQVNQRANAMGIQPPPVKIGTITYTWGETLLNIAGADGLFVQKIFNPGVPSLFGNNISTFSAELTPEGATAYEAALQGKGGFVSVVYKLKFWAKLPPMQVHAWFNSSQFYSFHQTIDVEWRFWDEDDYRETVREQMIESQSMGVELDPGGITDDKLKAQMRDWAFRTLEDYVEKKMIESIAPVPEDQRKLPDGIENVTRDISSTKISNFDLRYKENATAEWFVAPQGTLPNITSLTDKNGKPVKWEDYAVTIDLDDPFFKQLRVDAMVNADFEALPIHSVEVKVLYNGKPMANLAPDAPEGEVVLKKADEVGHFATFVDADNWKYKYSYQINYKGASQVFRSPEIETDDGTLVIGVDDVGILTVDVAAGDINWNEVDSAQVKLTYEDPGEGIAPIEDQFVLTKENNTHLFQRVIFKPFRRPYKYSVKFFTKDGKEWKTGEQEGRAHNLFINDPFSGTKTIKVLGVGDLTNRISNIFVDLSYTDELNSYTQTKSVALNKDKPFMDWVFPVLNESLGKVSYSGTVALADGTARSFGPLTTESNSIMVPKPFASNLEVFITPDLLDFASYKLVRLSLAYEDPENFHGERKDFVFTPAAKTSQTWKIGLVNPAKNQYTWEATFFMNDNTQKKVGPNTTGDLTVVLSPPA